MGTWEVKVRPMLGSGAAATNNHLPHKEAPTGHLR
jgi:hypothetical protein